MPDWAAPDLSHSRAVLLGCSEYKNLSPVPAAANSMDRMYRLLTRPSLCNWPVDRVTKLEQERKPGDLPDRLVEFYADVEDVALFYFVGHGQPDPSDRLCLALTDTVTQPERRATTSLTFDDVRNAFTSSPAKIKIVLLDCCYAGLALEGAGTLGDMNMYELTSGTGAFILAATGAFKTAWFETDPGNYRPQTYFTKTFADIIESGIPGCGPMLTLSDIAWQLREDLAGLVPSLPVQHTRDFANTFPFTLNVLAADQYLPHVPSDGPSIIAGSYLDERSLPFYPRWDEPGPLSRAAAAVRKVTGPLPRAAVALRNPETPFQYEIPSRYLGLSAPKPASLETAPQETAPQETAPQETAPQERRQGMNPSDATELDVPTIMRIGAARMTAGLDRMGRLNLSAHTEIFGPLPRKSAQELIDAAKQVNLLGQGGAAFPFAWKLKTVVDAARKSRERTVVVVNCAETEPGSFKDKMLMIRSPYLILSGAALVAEALEAEEVIIGVTGNEVANRSIEAAIAAEPGLRQLVRVVQYPERFISGESSTIVRGINGKKLGRTRRKARTAQGGVDGLPTLLANASTYAQVAVLALLGSEKFASVGVPGEPGTVLLSVSGSAYRPAVVECPTGVPLGAVLDICQAPAGDGVLVGGYHGMWLDPETAYQVPIGRGGLAAAGGTFGPGVVLPLGDGTCPLGEAARVASCLAAESAGHCQSCKLRLPLLARTLNEILSGSLGIAAINAMRRDAATPPRDACAHTDGTTRFVLSALEVFTEDLTAHVIHSTCGRPVRGMLPLRLDDEPGERGSRPLPRPVSSPTPRSGRHRS